MSDQAWVALAALFFVVIAQAVVVVWWAATANSRINGLEEDAKKHSDVRDLVIELRTEMRSVFSSIKDLSESIRQNGNVKVPAQRRNQTGG